MSTDNNEIKTEYNDRAQAKAKMRKLAQDVMILSRNTLLVNLRFLDMALSRFTHSPMEKIPYATNGQFIVYDPRQVLKDYVEAKEIPVRAYLHMVLHAIFRHMYIHSLVEQDCWDLACDIAVETIINDMNLKCTVIDGRKAQQEAVIEVLKKDVRILTAERIYRYYMDQALDHDKLADLQKLFMMDNHFMWYVTEDKQENILNQGNKDSLNQAVTNDIEDAHDPESVEQQENQEYEMQKMMSQSQSDAESDWKDISEHIQTDLETFQREHGDTAGGMLQTLSALNRERYDYASFLKKFAQRGEVMKINDDEFDYIYYTYGLKLYKKVPLIEPLEYKEVSRIKDFVIAIDTSGSVEGALVQRFVEKTYNILKSTESFFTKIHLHIIQCDAAIQEDVLITSEEEFDQYIKNMELHGFGETDFRPVFKRVDELIASKEMRNLKGLIYFTDGYGKFPEKKPDYETAFVFLDDDCQNPEVPSWAIRLVLESHEIREM